jgi:dihydroflavonol-4-reductase
LAVAWLSELCADHLTGRPPKATLTGVRLARRIMHFDSSRSLAELGLSPRSIRESLADAVSWLRSTGQLPSLAQVADPDPFLNNR